MNAFWEKLKWAKRVFAQVEEYYQLARKAAREAAEKVAEAARRAKAAAEAAAKAAKERAEAAARKAAKAAAATAKKAKEVGEKAAKVGKEAAKEAAWGAFGNVAGQAANEVIYSNHDDVDPMNLVWAGIGGAVGGVAGKRGGVVAGAATSSFVTNGLIQYNGDEAFSVTQLAVATGIGTLIGIGNRKLDKADLRAAQEFPPFRPDPRGTAFASAIAKSMVISVDGCGWRWML